MVNNIGITLLNKAAFQSVSFGYPYFLSAVHMLCNWAGSEMVFYLSQDANESKLVTQLLGEIRRQKLDNRGRKLIMYFSVIFSLNIAIGNVSLKYVTVNFNQVSLAYAACAVVLNQHHLSR